MSEKPDSQEVKFACKSNYGPWSKGKPTGLCGNKAMNLILFYAKVQNFSPSPSFNMYFTIIQIQFFCLLLVWPSLTFITASILLQGDFGPMPEKK